MFGLGKKKKKNAPEVVEIGKAAPQRKEKQEKLPPTGDVRAIGATGVKPEPDSTEATAGKGKKKNGKAKKVNRKLSRAFRDALKVPKTVQQAIPYKAVYPNGMIETQDGDFTKAYRLTDANFRTATQQAQEDMYFAYGDLLNYFSTKARPQFVIINREVDIEEFKKNILFQEQDDNYNELREDLNSIMLSKVEEGQNNIVQDKYLVITITAENAMIASRTFNRVDGEVSALIKPINDSSTEPMTLKERLEVLYNIYHQNSDVRFMQKGVVDGQEARTFDLQWMLEQGLTTKDIIGPDSLTFEYDYFKIDDIYGRSMFLRNLPTQLNADVLADIARLPCAAITSVQFQPMDQTDAIKMVRNQMFEVTRNMADAAKRNAKSGLGTEFLSPDLVQNKKDANTIYEDLTVRDQRAFLMTVTVTVFADTPEKLNTYTRNAQNNAKKHLCALDVLNTQQRHGFNSCLPLNVKDVRTDRFMNTLAASLFVPFESQELVQNHGFYYGINATSGNMIMFNRLSGQNSNGLILGMPGSGKSFSAKAEMTQAFLSSEKNEIFVIDPQAEYRPLCDALGGQVVRIAPGSDTHINPFDMDTSADTKDGDDPVTVKSNYICSICESAVGGMYGLNPVQVSVIDRCVRKLYDGYLAKLDKRNAEIDRENETIEEENLKIKDEKDKKPLKPRITIDRSICPTFMDFYNELGRQPEPEAEYIRLAIEKYCTGSYNQFAYRTNIETNNRFVVYDIRDIGTGMREIGMQVCLNDIWSRCIANRKRNVRTWIYIDELYVLTQSESCARFLMYIFKQARKFGGAPTGITQNVEDLLTNRESRGIINNCAFIMMMNQSAEDRAQIGNMLHISEAQLNYIKNAESGHGLIYSGRSIIPFVNRYPQGNKLYNVISTNPNEAEPKDDKGGNGDSENADNSEN